MCYEESENYYTWSILTEIFTHTLQKQSHKCILPVVLTVLDVRFHTQPYTSHDQNAAQQQPSHRHQQTHVCQMAVFVFLHPIYRLMTPKQTTTKLISRTKRKTTKVHLYNLLIFTIYAQLMNGKLCRKTSVR